MKERKTIPNQDQLQEEIKSLLERIDKLTEQLAREQRMLHYRRTILCAELDRELIAKKAEVKPLKKPWWSYFAFGRAFMKRFRKSTYDDVKSAVREQEAKNTHYGLAEAARKTVESNLYDDKKISSAVSTAKLYFKALTESVAHLLRGSIINIDKSQEKIKTAQGLLKTKQDTLDVLKKSWQMKNYVSPDRTRVRRSPSPIGSE